MATILCIDDGPKLREYHRAVLAGPTAMRFIMTETYNWHQVYQVALLETDWSKIEGRIQAVETALNERKNEFALNHGGTPAENQAIEDVRHRLDILRKEVAAWHESKQASLN